MVHSSCMGLSPKFTMSNMNSSIEQPWSRQISTKIRSACDICHHSKIKCHGGNPCEGCKRSGARCRYSQSNRVGRPKGVKNQRNLQCAEAQGRARGKHRQLGTKGIARSQQALPDTGYEHSRIEVENVLHPMPSSTGSGMYLDILSLQEFLAHQL